MQNSILNSFIYSFKYKTKLNCDEFNLFLSLKTIQILPLQFFTQLLNFHVCIKNCIGVYLYLSNSCLVKQKKQQESLS